VVEALKERLAQPEQEPVVGTKTWFEDGKVVTQYLHPSDIYIDPPQRTWVSLSDEDRNDCLVEADPCECLAEPEAQELMRCVEAKSRSKNQ
jgi:hypothetical protein